MSIGSRSLFVVLAACFALAAGSGSARAQMRCSIVTASGVSFGGYDTYSLKSLDSTGTIAYQCSDVGADDMIVLQLSRGNGSSFFPRSMAGRRFHLAYNLYLDAARTLVWGDGNGNTSVYTTRPPEGRSVSVPIFGSIPARQNVARGTYSDVIVLTVLY